jgi:hypothetical protein
MHSCQLERALVVQVAARQVCREELRHVDVAVRKLRGNLVRLVVHVFRSGGELLEQGVWPVALHKERRRLALGGLHDLMTAAR